MTSHPLHPAARQSLFDSDLPATADTVFAVADDDSALQTLILMLRSSGWPVRAFSSTLDCLRVARTQPPHNIVGNVDFSSVNGADLLLGLADDSIAVPVIVVTAMPFDSSLVELAQQMGLSALLRRPLRDGELEWALESATAPVPVPN